MLLCRLEFRDSFLSSYSVLKRDFGGLAWDEEGEGVGAVKYSEEIAGKKVVVSTF